VILEGSTRYTLLLSSLPYLPPPLSQQRFIPPSRIQIGKALDLLGEEDTLRMQRINSVLHWSHLPLERDDVAMVAEAEKLLVDEESPFLREVILERLELRTLIAAMRYRELNGTPQPGKFRAIGRYTGRILTNWHDPAFGMGHLFGWLNEAVRLLHSGNSLALDRLLMHESWRRLQRIDDHYDYGFDAVVLYVMRWNILDRLSRQHEEVAINRFKSMVNDALDGQQLVFEPEGAK
jgi:hypothetical protein